MSDVVQENIRCPRCNVESPFPIWRSLNVTLNPQEKQLLLSGQLLRFTCPGCGAVTQIVYPMLYHDMGLKLMIWMAPPDADGQVPEPEGPAIQERGAAMQDYTARAVGSLNELLEKILIFDAQLDDVALEMVKVVIATQFQAAGQPADAKIHFAQIDRDPTGQEQLVFAVVTPTGTRGAALPREPMYSNMKNAVAELSSRRPPPPARWPRVDNAYLMRIMDQSLGT